MGSGRQNVSFIFLLRSRWISRQGSFSSLKWTLGPDKWRFDGHEALEDIGLCPLCRCRRGEEEAPSLSKPLDSSHEPCGQRIDF